MKTEPAPTAKDTAEMTALARAAGSTQKEGHPLRNPDHLARRFLSPRKGFLADLCKIPPFRKLIDFAYARTAPGAARYILARTKHFDAVLLEELERGIEQVVLLGAGYDTRPYRFADRMKGAIAFELDHPGTAERKKQHLEKIYDGRVPSHVRLVPIDFLHESIEARLLESGYDPKKRTFFLWEGVTYYLTPEAIDTVLAFIASKSGSGSSVIFDYIDQDVVEGRSTAFGAPEIQKRVKKGGEPFTFGMPAGGVRPFLEARGFELVTDVGATELDQKYLIDRDGTSVGHVSGFFGIVHARIKA